MAGKQKISDFREELDRTLASPTLSHKDSIRELVQNQMHSSSSEAQEQRVTELCDLLDLMRSASIDHLKASKTAHEAWMLKEDNKDYRVMYREGPKGTPFQTILAEGYVNASLDVCLCAGWEANLFCKWFPQYTFPHFKVNTCCCLKEVRVNEHISLIRMKVPWPFSDREIVLEYFEIEYLEDGLVIVLLDSISGTESSKYMEEFKEFELPKSTDCVSMDLKVGGFVMKKITSNISYFRFVVNIYEYIKEKVKNGVPRG